MSAPKAALRNHGVHADVIRFRNLVAPDYFVLRQCVICFVTSWVGANRIDSIGSAARTSWL